VPESNTAKYRFHRGVRRDHSPVPAGLQVTRFIANCAVTQITKAIIARDMCGDPLLSAPCAIGCRVQINGPKYRNVSGIAAGGRPVWAGLNSQIKHGKTSDALP
jgi:hypothetical protein